MTKLEKCAAVATIGGFLVAIAYFFLPQTTSMQTSGKNSPVVMGDKNTILYADSNDPSYTNEREQDLTNLSAEEVVKNFFALYNAKQFRSACSLFKRSKCDATSGEDLMNFSRESEKQLNGYEDIRVWTPSVRMASETVCGKYKYRYKTDSNPAYTWEIILFYIDKREDGVREITSRVCEKKFKEGYGDRECEKLTGARFCI